VSAEPDRNALTSHNRILQGFFVTISHAIDFFCLYILLEKGFFVIFSRKKRFFSIFLGFFLTLYHTKDFF